MKWPNAVSAFAFAVARQDPVLLAARLTLLLMVLYGEAVWRLQIPTIMIAAVGLTFPQAIRHRGLWCLLALLQGLIILPNAYLVDNHKLLLLYWTIALCFSVGSAAVLRTNARLLLSMCFVLAFSWKAIMGEYLDGSFLHFTMLTDSRFAFFTYLICNVPLEALHSNAHRLSALARGQHDSMELLDSSSSLAISLLGSYWTLGTELALGVLFLLPLAGRKFLLNIRCLLLAQFIVITYPIATVIGFGWLLAILGYAQCEPEQAGYRASFIGLFILLQLFLVPWGSLLLRLS